MGVEELAFCNLQLMVHRIVHTYNFINYTRLPPQLQSSASSVMPFCSSIIKIIRLNLQNSRMPSTSTY